jgi:cytoskeletal protein RodZ
MLPTTTIAVRGTTIAGAVRRVSVWPRAASVIRLLQSRTEPFQLFEGPPGVDGSPEPDWSSERVKPKQIKLVSAGIGAGAVIAMGGLGVVFSDVSTAQPEPAPPGPVTTSEITTGETSTQCEINAEETAPPAEGTAPAEETSAECAAPPEPTVPEATPEITATSAAP